MTLMDQIAAAAVDTLRDLFGLPERLGSRDDYTLAGPG